METARIPHGLSLATGALLLLTACGGGDAGPGAGLVWEAVHDTVGDTVVVRTVSGSVWGDTMTLVPEVRIGELEGADEYLLGNVSAVALGPEGRIYVLDRQVPAIRVYDSTGTYLTDLGREGGGPGEYKQPRALAVLSDGRLLVRDPGNTRISVFGPDGAYETGWPIRGGFSTSRPQYTDRDDNTYVSLLLDPEAELSDWEVGLLQIRPDGTEGDTLRPPTTDFEAPFVEARSENSWIRNSVPFSPTDGWHLSPEGYFVFGVSTRYALDLYKPEGILRIAKDYEPAPVRPGEAAQRKNAITRNFRRNFGSWRWNGPDIPDHKPPYRSFLVDGDGRIWVVVSQPAVEEPNPDYDPEEEGSHQTRWVEPLAFDVFEPDGRFLGHVRAPNGLGLYPAPVFRGDRVLGVSRDDLGVQRVVRYRLEATGAGEATD